MDLRGKATGIDFHSTFTLFVDNLPEDVSIAWFKNLFNKFGVVRDAFIPLKRSKVTGRRFGFVRYNCSVSADVAITKTNGLWIEDRKLFVKLASFEAKGAYQDQNKKVQEQVKGGGTQRKEINKPLFLAETNNTGGGGWFSGKENQWLSKRSFAQAVKGENIGMEYNNTFRKEESIMRKFEAKVSEDGWLFRSMVAKLHKLMTLEDLKREFKNHCAYNVQFRSMGGRVILITCLNKEICDEIIKEKWWQLWFSELKIWDGEAASRERFAWLNCHGVPLNAWNKTTFQRIGEFWGYFISTDKSTTDFDSFVKSRVLVATENFDRIYGWITIVVNGTEYNVKVQEEEDYNLSIDSLTSSLGSDLREFQRSPMGDDEVGEEDEVEAGLDKETKSDEVSKNVQNVPIAGDEFFEIHGDKQKHDSETLLAQLPWVTEGINLQEVVAENLCKGNREGDGSSGPLISQGADSNPLQDNISSNVQAQFHNEFVRDSEPVDVAVNNNHKEVVDFDQGFWNLSEVGFFNEEDVQGIQLVVDLNPTDSVEDIGKGKRKHKRIEGKFGFPKSKKKGRRKQKKCVVFRSAIAAAALSVSSDGINKIHLNAAQASRSISKILEEDYLGEDDEIISTFSVAT